MGEFRATRRPRARTKVSRTKKEKKATVMTMMKMKGARTRATRGTSATKVAILCACLLALALGASAEYLPDAAGNVTMDGTTMGNATEMANDTIAESGELAPDMADAEPADLGRKLLGADRELLQAVRRDPCRCGPCQRVELYGMGAHVCYVADPNRCGRGIPSILRPGQKYNF